MACIYISVLNTVYCCGVSGGGGVELGFAANRPRGEQHTAKSKGTGASDVCICIYVSVHVSVSITGG